MFGYYLRLLEALRVVKKASRVNNDEESEIIGTIRNKEIIRTKHTKEFRGSEVRDRDMTNKDYFEIIKKEFDKLNSNGTYVIDYKNKNDKYDSLVIAVKSDKIVIITIVQQNRDKPNYKFKPGDTKLISESLDIIFI